MALPFSRRKIPAGREVEGCRVNGDAYGLNNYRCTKCGFAVAILWDDA